MTENEGRRGGSDETENRQNDCGTERETTTVQSKSGKGE